MRKFMCVDYVLDDFVTVIYVRNKGKMGYIVGTCFGYVGKDKVNTKTTHTVQICVKLDSGAYEKKNIKVSENNLYKSIE